MRKIDADKFKKVLEDYLEFGESQTKKWTEKENFRNADVCSFLEMNIIHIIKLLEEQPTVDGWIPIEKKKPPVCEDVLVTAYAKVTGGKRNGELTKIRAEGVLNWRGEWELSGPIGWIDYTSPENEVIAWQPLPEEYEVGARWK